MIAFSGLTYRILFTQQDALRPVRSAEGRFHHSGQFAIYTSLTPEGCAVAIKRYLNSTDADRHVVPLKVSLTTVADLRGQPEASVVWQDQRAGGHRASTWTLSDRVRENGGLGLLYSSRSRPDLTHLVLFSGSPEHITVAGDPHPFPF